MNIYIIPAYPVCQMDFSGFSTFNRNVTSGNVGHGLEKESPALTALSYSSNKEIRKFDREGLIGESAASSSKQTMV
jgi:hypothetical protein